MERADRASVFPAAERRTPQPWTEILDLTFPRARRDTRRSLAAKADLRVFRPRQTVIPQGDEMHVGLVVDGHVAVRRTTLDGHEVIPAIVTRGQLAPFLPIARRPASAESLALSPSRVAVWHADDVQALAAADAGLAMDLLGQVLRAFEELVERLDGLHHQNARGRVAHILDRHAEVIFGEEAIVTRRLLPALVGTSREMTGRVLRELESDGIVERTGKDGLRLVDAAGLAQVAASPPITREREARNMFLAPPERRVQE